MTTEFQRKHPLAKCEECPLYTVGKYVPSKGPEKAKIAFVGEAPGVQEARQGEPFTGPAGKLLNIVMSHHGIKREEVLLSYACACKPPTNDPPAKAAIAACRDRVLDELQSRGVQTTVALGNSASDSLLGKSGVTNLRVGPGRQSKYIPNMRVVSTFHPAAALRQADFFPHIVTDIGKVVVDNAVWSDPTYVVADTVVDAISYLDQLGEREGPVSVDIEVGIEKDTSFDHPNNYDMLSVGIGYAPGKALVLSEGVLGSGEVRAKLGQLLRSKQLIMQNGKFDMAGLYPVIGKVELWFDTMLASYVFDERPGIHGLKYQAVEYLGAPQYDEEIKKYVGKNDSYALIPRDKLYKYNAVDAVVTYALYEMYEKKFALEENAGLRKVHDFLVAAANQIMYLEMNGIAIDLDYLDELTDSYLSILDGIEDEIDAIITKDYDKKGGLNPRSPMQVKAYLLDQGIRVDTTNEETLKLILTKVEPTSEVAQFVRTLLRHRREAKLYGTYVKGIRKRLYGGRVHPTFNLHGTTTGRLACRNPNLQNIPRESSIRKQFVPAKPDNVFIQVDYSQAELRVLSFLAGDTYFRDIFNEGKRDLFDELTPILYPDADKATMEEAEWKELRIRVKAYVYGLSYGREAGSIATEFGISVREAVEGMNAFFSVIPEIVEFREETKRKVLNQEDLVTPWGRRRRFPLITKENKHSVLNEALAFMPQSTASDMCVMALTNVRQDLVGTGYVRNIVHDSLLIECHEDDAEEVVEITNKRMLEAAEFIVGDYVKFATDYKIGKNWGEV